MTDLSDNELGFLDDDDEPASDALALVVFAGHTNRIDLNGEAFADWAAWKCRDHGFIASCEALMVERGLGEAYSEALANELIGSTDPAHETETFLVSWIWKIRTAPLSTVLRALAAVVRATP